MHRELKPYILKFEFRGVPLEARRIHAGISPHTKWMTETYAVHHPEEPGQPIDQIEIFHDRNSDDWVHWPTKFTSDHRPLGQTLATARTASPELHSYKVKVELHKYVDLSDRPTTKTIISEGTNSSDAVYRLRDIITKDNVLILQSGNKRYVGRVHLENVSGPMD
jgi:hypothetical protein